MAYGAREAAIAGPASPAGAEATYYYWDHLGTVRMTAGGNPTAETVERHDYEPYGLEMGPATNTSGNTHQFTGHERDALGGGTNAALDYMHFRYYSPTAGRFMKPDNIPGNLANPQSWNKYSYVTGNPVNLNDPTGHAPSAGWLNDVVGGGDPWTNGGDSSKRQGLSNQAPKEDPPPPPPPTPPTQPPTPPTPPGPPPSEDPVPSPCDGTLLPGDKIPIALNAQKVGEIIYCFQDLRKDPVQTTPKGNGTQAINRGAEAGLKLANKVLQKETSILGGGGNICIEVSTIFRVPTCGGQLFVAQPQDRMRPDNPLGPFVSSHEQQIDPTAMPSGLAYNGPYLGPYPFAP
jgi:RHS repeat-associated protein